jgi:2-furoyl-CoA dehydrogenase large subunit
VKAPAQEVWRMLLDPNTLADIIPGCRKIEKLSDTHFRAEIHLGIGPVKGDYRAEVRLADLVPPKSATLHASATGALGFGGGSGRVTLVPDGNGTRLTYEYEAEIGGKVASVGGRLLDATARLVIRQFFAALARRAAPRSAGWWRSWSRK